MSAFTVVNNPINLLIQSVLPLQGGIKVIGPVGPLLGPQETDPQDIPKHLLQGLSVFFVHSQQEEGEHDQNHAEGRGAVAQGLLQNEEKRNANQRPAAEAD
jgi:hypothetical protein